MAPQDLSGSHRLLKVRAVQPSELSWDDKESLQPEMESVVGDQREESSEKVRRPSDMDDTGHSQTCPAQETLFVSVGWNLKKYLSGNMTLLWSISNTLSKSISY